MVEKLRKWSWEKQLLDASAKSSLEILDQITAVYSPNPCGPLSLRTRLHKDQALDLIDLENQKLLVRVPAMRGSVHIYQKKDFHWLRPACLELPNDPFWDKRYSHISRNVDDQIEERFVEKIESLFTQPLSAKEIQAMDLVPKEMLKPLINKLCFKNILIRVGNESYTSNLINYSSVNQRFGNELSIINIEEAKVRLAKNYFKAFSPARVKDFAWWANLSQKDAKKYMAEIDLIELEDGYFIGKELLEEFNSFDPKFEITTINILPQWDAYTMGYAPDGRQRLIDDQHLTELYGKIGATGGNAFPCIMINGLVKAIWKSQKKSSKLSISIMPLQKLNKKIKQDIINEFDELAPLLDVKSIVVTYQD